MQNSLISLFLVFFLASTVNSIQEIDFGKHDFLLQNLGGAIDVLFTGNSLLAVTERDVVASLALKNVSTPLEWRSVLKEPILTHLFAKKALLAASRGRVAAYDATGVLIWSHLIQVTDSVQLLEVDAERVAVLAGTTVTLLKTAQGSLVKEWAVEKIDRLHYSATRGLVGVVSAVSGASVTVNLASFSEEKGRRDLGTLTFPTSDARLPGSTLLSKDTFFVALGGSIHVVDLETVQTVSSIALSEYHPSGDNFFQSCRSDLRAVNQNYAIYRGWSEKSSVTLLFDLATKTAISLDNTILSITEARSAEDVARVVVYNKTGRALTTCAFTPKGLVWDEYEMRPFEERYTPVNAWHYVKDKTIFFAVRAIDDSLSLYSGSLRTGEDSTFPTTLIWRRQEGLASLEGSLIVDLPVDMTKYAQLKAEFEEKNYFERAFSQATHVLDFFSGLSKKLSFGSARGPKPLVFTRDHFGYRRLLISFSKRGHVFGVHTEGGAVLWSNYFHALSITQVFSLHTEGTSTTNILALAREKENASKFWAIEIDSISGAIVSQQALPTPIVTASQISVPLGNADQTEDESSAHANVIVLVDESLGVTSFPKESGQLLQRYIAAHSNKVFFFLSSVTEGTVKGYGLEARNNQLQGVLRWTKVFAENQNTCDASGSCNANESTGTRLLSVQQTKINEVSPAAPLANGKVLWKYLNANMVVATTVNSKDAIVTLHFLDVVSGRLLYSLSHADALGPVNLVVWNNWAVYHYWNTKTHSYFLSVVDLFEAEAHWKRKVMTSLDDIPAKKNAAQSALQVFKQSFYFPHAVTTMGSTASSLGMTNSYLLIGLARDAIMAIDKRVLDARRQVRPGHQPNDEDFREGLMPYRAVVDLSPLAFVTFNRTVHQLRSIYTCASHLESTSLVVAQGLDLYFVAAAGVSGKTFDRLDSNFQTGLLFVASIVIFVGAVFAHFYAKNYNLRQAWR